MSKIKTVCKACGKQRNRQIELEEKFFSALCADHIVDADKMVAEKAPMGQGSDAMNAWISRQLEAGVSSFDIYEAMGSMLVDPSTGMPISRSQFLATEKDAKPEGISFIFYAPYAATGRPALRSAQYDPMPEYAKFRAVEILEAKEISNG